MAVLTLALGIGANTAVFSVINSVVLEPLPFKDPGRLVMLWSSNPAVGIETEQVALADFFDWQQQSQVFECMGLVVNQMAASRNFLLQVGDVPLRIRGRYVSAAMFEVLGVRPILGRALEPSDDVQGGEKVVVLSYGLWQRAFSADPKVIGRTIDVGDSYRVVGVMPRGFGFPPDAELWMSWPASAYRARNASRGTH
ncbi:MAG: ABC transporter permease, partial [Planctomycetes bacterium]|nr:ABC transporter permease [Planctomycetota bacterium]